MMRIGMTMAAVLAAGGLLLAPESAYACEKHGQAARAPQAKDSAAKKDVAVQRPLEELDSLMSAKCQCGSAADCTCKKGTCDCARCKKPRRQVVDALSDQNDLPKVQEARYDASAGVFI
jgi:hypothetical protein